MNVLLFTKYESLGASSRVRCLQYINYLKEYNVNIDVMPLITNEMLEERFASKKSHSIFKSARQILKRIYHTRNVAGYDIVWIQKEFLPNMPYVVESFFLKSAKALILDLDDAEFLKYQKGIRKFFLNKKYSSIAKSFNSVVVGNDYLSERIQSWGGSTILIPSVIDYHEYQNVGINTETVCVDSKFVIGWIGSPSTEKYIDMLVPVVEKFAASIDASVEFHLIGASKGMQKKSKHIRVFEWKKETEVSRLSRFDVGVMPLELSEWEKGKCSFKAIQCMAAGKPVVVSPTQANCELVENKVNGFVAETPDEWFKAFENLFYNNEVKVAMGQVNKKKIKDNFSVQSQVSRLNNLFSNVHGGLKLK